MIHGDTKAPEGYAADDEDDVPVARPVLGKLKTDEETRLAREIEKLRGLPSRPGDQTGDQTGDDGDA